MERYVAGLRIRGRSDGFLDLDTAEKVAAGCLHLLDQLAPGMEPEPHHAVQAAVLYFVLEDDAEADDSVIGFDDDLQVLDTTAQYLGWSLSEGSQ